MTEYRRREGWESRLAAFIESRRHAPFAWGSNDCALFAADAVVELTGEDPAVDLRGYRSAVGAARVLHRMKCATVAAVPSRVGFAERLPIDARRGDLVAFNGDNGPTLGVVLGERFAAPGPRWLLFFRLDAASSAWRVG